MKDLHKATPAYQDLDLGYAALKKGAYEKALTLAKDGIKIEPREAHLFNLKGKAEVQLKRPTEALTSFNKAIALNPDYFDFYLQRGNVKYQLGDLNGSQKDLEASNTLLPSADAYLTLGEIAWVRGDEEKALGYFLVAAEAHSEAGEQAREHLNKLEK